MKHGEKIMYIDRWPIIDIKILFYLFDVPSSYDPIHKALCATDEKFVLQVPDFSAYTNKKNLMHGHEMYFIDDLAYARPFSERKFKNIEKLINYIKSNYPKIQNKIPDYWDFHDSKIRSFQFSYYKLKTYLLYLNTKNWLLDILKYFIFPITSLPFLDFYFLYINFKKYRLENRVLQKLDEDLKNAHRISLYNSTSEAKQREEISREIAEAKSEIKSSRESLLSSSRAASTLLIALLTLSFTIIYYRCKELNYEEKMRILQNKNDSLVDRLKTEEEEIRAIREEVNNLKFVELERIVKQRK